MSNLIKSQIEANFSSFILSDHSSLKSRISEIIFKNQNVGFSIDITGITLEEANTIKNDLISRIEKIPDINKVNIVLTSGKSAEKNSKIILEKIDKVILVAAGKGGVGKSTVSALLAQKLASEGNRVGLLDADIYGPSIPHIFNLNAKPEIIEKKMVPLENYGVKVNSIGFITDPNSSISWRGPMTSKALYQLISLTDWGVLDYLIIDTPPGTGDIHLSLLQNYTLSGVLMVTNPQKIAAIDVVRAINLYQKFDIPILGIIENMSYYVDENSNEKMNIFSGNSAEEISKKYNVPLLIKIPLNPRLSQNCDDGKMLSNYFDLLEFKI